MSKTLWIFLLLIWMVGSTWWHVCKIKQLCADDLQPTTIRSTDTPLFTAPSGTSGFTIADGNKFRLDLPGNISFATSGTNANMNTLGGSLETLFDYVKANPDRKIEIVGYYAPAETNKSSFENLGLARAEAIKQYLVQQRIPARSITAKGVERNLAFTTKGDSLYGGIDFAFGGAEPANATSSTSEPLAVLNEPTSEKELAEGQRYTSVFEPIDLYFPLGEANYIKTDDTKKFFEEAVKFLAANKSKKLILTGHTDNSGPEDANMRLSKNRANEVKSKLRKSGIEADQIEVIARGESEPKADNKTLSGRKANRRVTVVVK